MSGFSRRDRDGYRRRVGEAEAGRRPRALMAGQQAVGGPALDYLAGAYFHQDFDLEADSPLGVVRKFRIAESPERVEAVSAEIRVLLGSGASEDRIAEIWLHSASYDPRRDGVAISRWLRTVLDELGGNE
ncbi:contact-dependent growth inhibition system immunity protein [Nocardia sp. NPDC024068]|uniref:contact-dependent growth inhibition system immunity protein n=1 Tax=Nocardia sp. NPDC024068 TaxID=3157197 RepID=UPI00340F6A67